MLYMNKPAEVIEDKAAPSDIEAIDIENYPNSIQVNDSLQKVNLQNTFGIFSYWMVDKGATTQVIENKQDSCLVKGKVIVNRKSFYRNEKVYYTIAVIFARGYL